MSQHPANTGRRRRRSAIIAGLLLSMAAIGAVGAAALPRFGAASVAVAVPPPPPAPVLIRTPASPTTSTRAHFQYRDAAKSVTFRCRLDGGLDTRCGSAVNYTRLSLGDHVFCVRAVGRGGLTSAATCFRWTIVTTSGLPFTIAGNGSGHLYPGGALVPVDLVVTNPNGDAITVTSVAVRIRGTSVAACAETNFAVARQLTATVTVPGRSTVSLSGLGVPRSAWPQLRMLDAGNQDACQRATVNLAFSGTAQG